MASAVLKLSSSFRLNKLSNATKPRYGFGCIETDFKTPIIIFFNATKPRYGFGCIETRPSRFLRKLKIFY
jgi:hypothetical protein